MKPIKLLFVLTTIIVFASCRKESLVTPASTVNQASDKKATTESTTTLSESFESGTKAAYAVGSVTLSSGSWSLDEALIGNTSADVKNGAKSVRTRNNGQLTMNFDATGGAETITIQHAVYGNDGSSTWQLWISTDGGSSYTQAGNTVTSSTSTLQAATFTVNVTGSYRLSIRKVSGGSNRINFDDIQVVTGGGTNPGGPGTGGTTGDDSHLLLGNPTGAQASVVLTQNYLRNATYYISSYNSVRGTPNWVSWHIASGDLGSAPRQDDFRADAALPSSWYQVGSSSYSSSGFDRGHNCPSADRTSTVAANSSTFLMSNMIPQAPQNNQQTWNNMEQYIRSLVTAGNEVYVIMGSYGTGGNGSKGNANTIDGGRVTVPSNVWKVVVVIPNGSNDLSRINAATRVIAVNTPNINTIGTDWKSYRTSVDAIESAAGVDLLSALPANIQSALESKVDNL
ncbi:DNA/RNA non-specific endonuclease [Chitinophaga nivalis]|uniref:DNA/RNA non-specific endonuclease n=1 Tax=Chitinophaga nivalis TaxID=2991709 RepID=A0ABT3IKP8_9BACT|nr:DNA/RNA non-specific endonuclease [Chitinophaga nivalis]MCW3465765.1 DNA/RNA non-specific endonuclease [Chitinophaga nivalis]MCW3484544.1 DNA/RNA non-specific endonuclease [Chitinophaga nivalis]